MGENTVQPTLFPFFGEGFLDDYAGRIISDPFIALVELVANCWDAGARNVRITWPDNIKGQFQIMDDGTGMSRSDFERIWRELNYDRIKNQGAIVIFPDASSKAKRTAYGRNGKGRHSLFCFSDEYWVETWKDNVSSIFNVKRSKGEVPYRIEFMNQYLKEGHGTKIYCNIYKNYIKMGTIQDLLGSKFIIDPLFSIYINEHKIELIDLKDIVAEEYPVNGEKVEILRIDSKLTGRTSKQHGVAWWVNNRLVGEHSWRGFEGTYLDGRSSEAKRFTFIVRADFMIDEIKPDWTDFKESEKANTIRQLVNSHIYKSIQNLVEESRKVTKREILLGYKTDLKLLSNLSRSQIGKFVEEIQMKCPTMTQDHLSNVVGILARMESSKTKYRLLQQLATLSKGDLDTLADILNEWTLTEAKAVLDELRWRLELIQKIEKLMEDPNTDELHELQPLFENGLWIFGPEYESIEFLSNKTLATIIKKYFGSEGELVHPKKRPDFIAFPDRSIGVYSSDDFDSNNEVSGLRKILIVELKKGGSTIRDAERRQAEDYAQEILKSGKINITPNTKIVGYVLGAKVESKSIKLDPGIIEVIPKSYNIVMQQAYARTFNLIRKIKESKEIVEESDEEIEDLLKQKEISDNFATSTAHT